MTPSILAATLPAPLLTAPGETSRRVHRSLIAYAQGADLQISTFEGREHLIAPVVLMVANIVVRPVSGDGRGEFTTASAISAAPGQWDGRPIIPGHPVNAKQHANTPRFLERRKFGTLFGSRYADFRLRSFMWVDPARASEVGPDADSVVDRLRKGQMVEVSVGAWVTMEEMKGEANGEQFDFVWQHVSSDHLAALPPDAKGACSGKDGCGAPRFFMAVQEDSTPEGDGSTPAKHDRLQTILSTPTAPKGNKTMKLHILTDLLERWGFKSAATITRETQAAGDTSIDSLFTELYSLIRAVEPAFEGILDVFLDSSTVVYAVSPDNATELFRRKFNASGETVTLSDKREAVQLKRTFEPLEGMPDPEGSSTGTPALEPTKAKEGAAAKPVITTAAPATLAPAPKPTKADLVEAMIASPETTFREDDRDTLSTFSETLLARLAADLTKAEHRPPGTPAEGCQCAGTCECQTPTSAGDGEGAGEGDGDQAKGQTGGPVAPASPATPAAAAAPAAVPVAAAAAATPTPAPAAPAAPAEPAQADPGVSVVLSLDGKALADSVISKLVSKPKTPNPSRLTPSSGQGALTMVSNRAKDLALRLIACEESPFTEADYDPVLKFTEERLHDLVQHYTPDNPPPKTEEEWLATAPDSIREMVIGYQAADAERRAELVLAITASQDEFTKEQLSCMKTSELEKLGKAMGLHKRFDYSGRGMPRDSAFGVVTPPPEPYTLALDKKREQTTH